MAPRSVRYAANRVRNTGVVSRAARSVLGPVARTCDAVARQIRSKVWISGATVTYGGTPLVFPPGVGVQFATPMYWRGDGGFEPEVWAALRALLGRAATFADIGANVGVYSVLAAKTFPHVAARAFEPVPALVDKNRAFQAANGVHVPVEAVALSDTDGHAVLELPVNDQVEEEQAGTIEPLTECVTEARHVERMTVATARLDTYCERESWRPDVLKIDVEGHEVAVLNGARRLLTEHQPAVVCEVLPGSPTVPALRDLLRSLAFTPFALLDAGAFHDDRFATDRTFRSYLFLPGLDHPTYYSFAALASPRL